MRDTSRRFAVLLFLLLVSVGCATGAVAAAAASDRATPAPTTAKSPHADNEEFTIVDPDQALMPDPTRPRPARRYDTYAHRVLDIDSEEAPASQAKYAKLDAIIADAVARIDYAPRVADGAARRAQAERILKQIDEVITAHNVLYPAGDYDVESLSIGLAPQRYDKDELERVLRVEVNARRRAHARAHADEPFYILDCDTSSMVYYAIAEVVGFDLHLVDLPDHMFVRWELGDGKHVNWDTNDAEVVSDKEYAADYGLKKGIRRKRVYLSSMTRKEAEGFAYFLRALRLEDRSEDARAIVDLERAREMYPQSTQAAAELAWLYATAANVPAEKRKASVALAQSALDLEPKCGDFWDSLAAAHAANGDFKEAIRCGERAEKYAQTSDERATFKAHRRAFERGEMPNAGPKTPAPAVPTTRESKSAAPRPAVDAPAPSH